MKLASKLNLATLQAVLEQEYEKEVAQPVEAMRQAMQREQGFSIPRSLPMMGGTTATTAIVVKKYLSLAWVGDSRAVLCAVRYTFSKGLNTVRTSYTLRGH